ncbi:MAG: tetratricopeptide repeat protein [candidate division WOR-3 bacterium]|nr:tetratricopeptide repeat protein [candidate division WOR-3 bacterium]
MGNTEFVFLSKLQIPELNPRTLYRGRLIKLLFQNRNKKLIFLCAGAGYGKTTLIVQFINEAKVPWVYYQLKKEDSDPAVFLPHLIAGIKSNYPQFGKNIYKLRQFFNLPPEMSNIVLGTLINEIIQNVNNDTYLILDDYHALDDSPAINDIILYLLENMPQRLHIIVSSRTNLPFSLASLKSKDEVYEMGPDNFRFTREEIEAFFITLFNIKLKSDEVGWLYEYSEGWPACLRLILQSYETTQGMDRTIFFTRLQENYKKITKDIFDYFSTEIFKKEPEENQKFLITCSLLDYLNPAICQVITGRQDARNILEDLAKRNAFIFPIPDGNYRLHALFQEFLKSHFSDENRKKEIYRLLGCYNEKENSEAALKYYLLAGDYSSVLRLIEVIGRQLLQHGKYSTLVSSIENIPEALLNNHPLVLKFYGESLSYLGNQLKAKEVLKKALKTCTTMRDVKAEVLYTLSGVLINEGKLKNALKLLEQSVKICPQGLYLLKASALNSLGAINNALGGKRLYQARTLFKMAYNIVERHNFPELKTSILNNWAMNEFKSGNLKEAYERIIPAARLLKNFFSPGCGAGFYNGTKIALMLGNREIAESLLEEGLNICQTFNDFWSIASIYRGYGLLYTEAGDLNRAREFFKKALTIYEQTKVPWLIVTTLIEICRVEIKDANFTEAEKILLRAKELKKTTDAESISLLSTEAELKIEQENYSGAEEVLREVIKLSKKYNLILEDFLAGLKLCRIFYKKNEIKKVIRNLKNLIKISEKKNYDFILMRELKNEPGLVNLIIKNRIKIDYITSLLKKHRFFHIVNIYLFGEPELEINFKKIHDEEWKTTKAKKLFFYLALNKNRGVTQEELIETFWKKAGLKKGYNSLRKAIQLIRQALRNYGIKEPVLVHAGVYKISPELYINSDVDEFERLITRFNKEGLQKDEYKRLLAIYKTGFAPAWYDDWAVEISDRYKFLLEKVKMKFNPEK